MSYENLSRQIDDLRSLIARTNPPEVMTPGEAAEFVGVTTETLYRWRKDGWGPKYSQINSRIVRYQKADLIAFLGEHRQ
ncbi:helix-turn-helix domain-containing protein [Roseovarius sp. MBR-6]|jgi:predicted DNA-binding transcriptional regulator AlpA|uniref:helix-turn-helix transcriptional regulator n=1 Tax=Roseovarius sp. MBR-6 TaxID=3156459 RepID=UPI0033996B87